MAKLIRPAARGEVALWRDGVLVWRKRNLVVNGGLNASAGVMGATTGDAAALLGYGSGNTAPQVTDTDLGLAPKYYNALTGSPSFPTLGSVTFTFELQSTDYGAYGITVQELGLYANPTSIQLPTYVGSAFGGWAASTVEAIGNVIADSNGNLQRVTAITSDDKTGSSHPTWATTVGSTTADNHVTWTMLTAGTVTGLLMIAHAVVPAFAFTGSANYSGSWTITY